MTKLSSEFIEDIAGYYIAGMSSTDLSMIYGISTPTVLEYVRKCGYNSRSITEINKQKIWPDAAASYVYKQYKATAKEKKLIFAISKSEFINIAKRNCFYCNAQPSNVCRPSEYKTSFIYNGMDRVDNTKGYEADNVVSCCKMCNKSKNNYSKLEFLAWVRRIAIHQGWAI